MRRFHNAGVRTTCFISPIFPGITDVKAIVARVKDQCNLIWLVNLNLRGGYKAGIMDYIRRQHFALLPLYQEIYDRNDRGYWQQLDTDLRTFAVEMGLDYLTNDDSMNRSFEDPPIMVNFFYHSEIKKNARKEGSGRAGNAGSGGCKTGA